MLLDLKENDGLTDMDFFRVRRSFMVFSWIRTIGFPFGLDSLLRIGLNSSLDLDRMVFPGSGF
jgi:hypothetical protein